VPRSILDAVKMGLWDFEPPEVDSEEFSASNAMPGTKEKLADMAQRVQLGLPIWNKNDRNDIETPPPGKPR